MTLALKKASTKADDSLHSLAPSQQKMFDLAVATISGSHITVIKGDVGAGKSLVIAHLQAHLGGTVYSIDQIMSEVVKRGGGKVEETVIDFIVSAFKREDVVFAEDITMLDGLGAPFAVDRPLYLHHIMGVIYEKIAASGKRLIVATADPLNQNNLTKATVLEMDGLAAKDYLTIIRNQLGTAPNFDSDKVSRTYKKLTCHEIVAGTNLVREKGITQPSADEFIDMMGQVKSRSNLVVDDVEDVTLDSLVGIEDVVRDLMRTVVIPMTQPVLARELGLKPARGILLHGEPGTGKTTIGRALARQMKGKFFIMDGSTLPEAAGPLFEAAEVSAPSVFFIDDADVIFKNGENSGFARKLLTKLDGLESESIGHVCIMMTAMNVADMPPAVVRSGRVEVWLHMDLPNARKRADIIRHYAKSLPDEMRQFDEASVVAATEGFAPADLRGLVGDARGHIAYDRHKGRPVKSFENYLLLAAEEIQERKAMLAELSGLAKHSGKRR